MLDLVLTPNLMTPRLKLDYTLIFVIFWNKVAVFLSPEYFQEESHLD